MRGIAFNLNENKPLLNGVLHGDRALDIYEIEENCRGIIVSVAGQIPNNLATQFLIKDVKYSVHNQFYL